MKPYYQDERVTLINNDCLLALREMPDRSVQTCVTSPPYFGLRDYGHDDQIGLEETPDAYVAKMVEVFREVRRVLREDGTLWLNLGDSYSGSGPSGASYQSATTKRRQNGGGVDGAFRVSKTLAARGLTYAEKKPIPTPGLKPKDLIGIPWRVAFALQADGWYLRQDIIWHKPNPMPESVTDRCTKSHEYIFLLSKSQKYYMDMEPIREPIKESNNGSIRSPKLGPDRMKNSREMNEVQYAEIKGANRRSVWTIATKPYSGAHFATFPEELIIPCILAGAPKDGVVLDPFFGAGTTGLVAKNNSRKAIGIELNEKYCEMAAKRLQQEVLW